MQSLSPTISVITVCYNAVKLLQVTMQSVADQTYPHLEYIVVDGASTDGSADILAKAKAEGMIHQLISEPDNGIYDAMNKGLRLASGDYLCFLNAGDTFHSSDTLERALGSLGKERPTVVYGDTDLVDEERRFLRKRVPMAPKRLTHNSFRRGMAVCHQSFYALRAVAPEYDERYRLSADFDWCLRILSHPTCTTHPTHLVLTDYLHEGATTRHRRKSLRERFRIMCYHYGLLATLLSHLFFLLRLPFKRLSA